MNGTLIILCSAIVKLLLASDHQVNVRTSYGTPLHEAALGGKVRNFINLISVIIYRY